MNDAQCPEELEIAPPHKMIAINEKLPDLRRDHCGRVLDQLARCKRGSREFTKVKSELLSALKKQKYISFQGAPNRYHIQRVGDSYLYKVPRNKRGHLSRFRGKTVRILVIARGDGWIDRELMAGPAVMSSRHK